MRQGEVYIHDTLAGIITETDSPREYIFSYTDEYLSSGKEPVCIAMPLTQQTYRSATLFPFFFNMLSEGANRAIQSSLLHIDADDDFGILLATAHSDSIGAINVKSVQN